MNRAPVFADPKSQVATIPTVRGWGKTLLRLFACWIVFSFVCLPGPAANPLVQVQKGDENTKVSTGSPASVHHVSEPGKALVLVVKVDSARVRALPSLDGPVIAGLGKGDIVGYLDVSDQWYHIRLKNGHAGWAHQSLFEGSPLPGLATPSASQGAAPAAASQGAVPAAASRPKPSAVAKVTPKAPPQPPGSTRILEVRFRRLDDGAEKLFIHYEGQIKVRASSREGNYPAVVCQFADTRLSDGIKRTIALKGQHIRQVEFSDDPAAAGTLQASLYLRFRKSYVVEPVLYKDKHLYVLTVRASQ